MTQIVNRTGFEQTNYGVNISKDVQARLTYTFDWSEWLDTGDTISTVDYEVAARRNDPTPIVKQSEGITGDGLNTYVELSGGQEDKVYIVTARVTTANGLIDRRNFRIHVENRSA
jgi:hypothetical protein